MSGSLMRVWLPTTSSLTNSTSSQRKKSNWTTSKSSSWAISHHWSQIMSWTRLVCTSCACTPKISQKQWISRSLRVAVAVVTIFFSEDSTKRGWSSRRPSKVNNIKSKGQLATHLIVCSFRAPQMRRSTSRAAKIKISSTNPQSSCVIRMLRSTSRWSSRRTLIG